MKKRINQEHHFNVGEATKYGIAKAVLLYNIRFWLNKNMSNKKNKHKHTDKNIYYWTYNSGKAFEKLFPYLKSKNISRWLLELERDEVLLSGNFNKVKYDRTKWYTIKNEFIIKCNNDTIYQKRPMDLPKTTNGLVKNDQPIPYSKQNIKPNSKLKKKSFSFKKGINTINTSDDKLTLSDLLKKYPLFNSFYSIYPKKVSNRLALKAFNNVNPNKELFNTILKDIEKKKKTEQWTKDNGKFIPNPSTYLNQKKWEDEENKKDSFLYA